MSRFYGKGLDSESESSDSDSEPISKPIVSAATFDLSDDEEESGKRVVKSAKEKRYGEITGLIQKIRNFRKNNDMSNILDCYEELTKAYQKALPVIQKEEKGVTPSFFLQALAQLELFVNQQWENKKNMSKNNSKSLATLRQKLRKYTKDYEDDLQKYRDNPDLLDEDEVEEDKYEEASGSESESEAEKKPKPAKKKDAPKRAPKDDEDSDSEMWDESDESSSSSDDDDYQDLRLKFLKKSPEEEELKKQKKKDEEKKRKAEQKKEKKVESEEDWEVVPRGGASQRPQMFQKDQDINAPVVVKKLAEITAVRGKKGTDRREQIELLVELEGISTKHELGPAVLVKIQFAIVAAIFDYSMKVHEIQKVQHWLKLLDKVSEMLSLATDNKDTLVIEENVPEDGEELEKAPYKVRGCLMTVFERADEEFVKVLKELDSHSFEYIERLQDEKRMCEILERLVQYLETTPNATDDTIMCRAYYKKVEHMYYKFDARVLKRKRGEYKGDTTVDELQKLCRFIYAKDSTGRLRTRAMLCHIYHHALHDNWFEARDLILMSHLQEDIHLSDPSTMIMYNRAMVQLGLCSFRHENVQDAHNSLADLLMSGRVKELLAQGLMPQHRHDRSPEQEKIERSRQVPFHMQLNLDVIECVYLTSAMLLEVPYLAEHEFDAKRRPISKTFYHQLRTLEKQSLTGPPESMREHVVAAARAMKKGDWEKCYNTLVNEKMDRKVWNFFSIYEITKDDVKVGVKDMIMRKVKEESMRTYLFTYSNVYDSISVPRLAELYSLDKKRVHSVVAKMIINQELMASMDEPSQTVVLHRTEPKRLQAMLLQLSDKINVLRETSDRNFESTKMQGGPGASGPGKGQRFNRPDWQNRRGGGRGRGRGRGGYRGGGGDRGDRGDRGEYRGNRGDRENRGERHQRE